MAKERSTTEDIIWAGMNVAEGIGFRAVASSALQLPEALSQIIAIGVPSAIAWLAGLPILPAALGAAAGSGGSYLYERLTASARRFLFWADSHGNPAMHRAVIARMVREEGADFAVFGGDAEDWTSWDEVVAPLREKLPVYAVRGNHDDLAEFKQRFAYATPFMVQHGSVEIWLLGYPAKREECDEIANRIEGRKTPAIVICHSPPYAFSEQNAADAERTFRAMRRLLDRGVVVLSGHQHLFGWTMLGRSNVVTAGIAGPKHYPCRPTLPEGVVCDDRVRGYLRVLVSDEGTRAELVPVEEVG